MSGPAKGTKMLADPKPCRGCGELLPRSAFPPLKSAKAPLGVRPRCRPCVNRDQRARHAQDPGQSSRFRRQNKLRSYGLTLEDFDRLAAQGCAICKTDTPGGKGSFHMDHCHSTGAFRGLLCHSCNVGLGVFGDSPETLEKAAEYLRERGSK